MPRQRVGRQFPSRIAGPAMRAEPNHIGSGGRPRGERIEDKESPAARWPVMSLYDLTGARQLITSVAPTSQLRHVLEASNSAQVGDPIAVTGALRNPQARTCWARSLCDSAGRLEPASSASGMITENSRLTCRRSPARFAPLVVLSAQG